MPYQKPKNIINHGNVGIDLDISTVAIVGNDETIWTHGCYWINSKTKRD
ncbi:MAG: hypothetical protein QNJ47_25690 [Nostocaceae cyanobacterium]|nr:hypothetical protein [Nostocaceae cyanobacterium]